MSAAAVLTQRRGWNSPVMHQEVFILGRSRMPDSQSKLSPSIPLYWLTPSGRKVEKPAVQCDLKKCIDILSRLPPELRAIILSYLNARDLCRCQQVSSNWYHVIAQDPYLMKRCKSHLRKMKTKYTNSKENYVHMAGTVTPHSSDSTGRSVLTSLHNSAGLPLYYSIPPILPTQSPSMIELLNFDRLRLRDDTASYSSDPSHDNVRRCLFPENEANRNSTIEDNLFSIRCRENKKRIKRL